MKRAATFLILFSTIVFAYSVEVRQPWFGKLADDNKQWQTGSTAIFAANWYHDSPWELRFGLFENPPSIEFQSLASRSHYSSYPPGAIVPVYLLAKILGQFPSLSLVMVYNLLSHFLTAIALGFIVLIILNDQCVNRILLAIYSCIPSGIYLLVPDVMYWHQHVFFADQAVILPFVLVILCEVVIDRLRQRRGRLITFGVQGLILFWGMLTDWLFIPVAFALLLKRLWTLYAAGWSWTRAWRHNLQIGIPIVLAITGFLVQTVALGSMDQLRQKFFLRSGLQETSDSSQWMSRLFGHYLGDATIVVTAAIMGITAVLVLAGAQIYLQGKKKCSPLIGRTLTIAWLSIIPCILLSFLLPNHITGSWNHEFTALKFWTSLSLLPFSLLSFTIINTLFQKFSKGILFVHFLAVLIAIAFIFHMHRGFENRFSSPSPYSDDLESFSQFVSFRDVVFSPNYEVEIIPPQRLAATMKRVYRVDKPQDIDRWLSKRPSISPNVVILSKGAWPEEWLSIARDSFLHRSGSFQWYRVSNNEVTKFPPN